MGVAGPVVLCYDGTDLAGFAIARAGEQLATPRNAVVVCVWQPADVCFQPVDGQHFDAADAVAVRQAAERTAEHGAELARQAGFTARALAVESAPVWEGIVRTADELNASIVVLGAHRHGALAGKLLGHVSPAVLSHVRAAVLVVHESD